MYSVRMRKRVDRNEIRVILSRKETKVLDREDSVGTLQEYDRWVTPESLYRRVLGEACFTYDNKKWKHDGEDKCIVRILASAHLGGHDVFDPLTIAKIRDILRGRNESH